MHLTCLRTHQPFFAVWSHEQDIQAKLRQDYVSTLVTELVIWPGYQVGSKIFKGRKQPAPGRKVPVHSCSIAQPTRVSGSSDESASP